MQENAFPLSWACWEQSFASSFIIKSCDLINYEWHFNGTAAARAWAQLTCFKRSLWGNLIFQAVRISQQSRHRACNADCEWAAFCARGEREKENELLARALVPAQLVFSRFLIPAHIQTTDKWRWNVSGQQTTWNQYILILKSPSSPTVYSVFLWGWCSVLGDACFHHRGGEKRQIKRASIFHTRYCHGIITHAVQTMAAPSHHAMRKNY